MIYLISRLKKLFFFLFLSLITVPLIAQTEKKDDEPVAKMTMEVLVKDHNDNPQQGKEIVFVDTVSKEQYSGITNEEGKFLVKLPSGSSYLVKIQEINQAENHQVFSIPKLQPGRRYGKSRFVIKHETPKVYTLDNVFFDVSKASLRDASYKELNELVEYLKRRTGVRIEIAGHTDSNGDDAMNMKLSQKRADRVKQYLVNQGIDVSRIVAKGYGETKPVARNTSSEGRQKNRRTEVHILEE
jgi:outer membrane protein OmpA-like peptidoglycan-associated protein